MYPSLPSSIHPSIHPFTYHTHPCILPTNPSMHFTNPSIHVFINPFIYLSIYTHPSIYPYFSPIHSILFRHFLYKSGQPKPSNDTLENIIYSPLVGSPPPLPLSFYMSMPAKIFKVYTFTIPQ